MLELGPGRGTRTGEDGGWGDRRSARPSVPPITRPRYHLCLQGSCQWVTLDFPRTVRVSQLHIQFQGGFSSRLCTLEGEGLREVRVLCLPLCTPEGLGAEPAAACRAP